MAHDLPHDLPHDQPQDHDTHEHPPRIVERHTDVAVIGGSAAGFGAALQLGRQRRSVIVIDAGDPRNAPAAHVHGYLGHEGIAPADLTAIARDEVRAYGVEVLPGRAVTVKRVDDGRFRVELTGGHAVVARRVVAATGLTDQLPDVPGVAEGWGRDVIHCPFCHGYEVRDRRVVQIVTHPMGLHPAPLLHRLTDRLVIVLHDPDGVDADAIDVLQAAGVEVVDERVERIVHADGGVEAVVLAGGRRFEADAVVVGPRFAARAEPFAELDLHPVPHPSGLGDVLETDAMGQTGVPGLYAAGNVTDPSLQVLHAASAGSWVGAMVAFDLARHDLAAAARPSANAIDWDRRYSGERVWSGNPNGALVAEVSGLDPGRALDVGAGEGGDAVWLAERGWTVTASDVSERALAQVGAEAERRRLSIELLLADANADDPFGGATYDLVTAHYASIPRTPDDRGLDNLLRAVAPGGTLLVVGHDPAPMRVPIDTSTQSRMFDADAYLGASDVAAAVRTDPAWEIEVDELRPRPPGAASASHHVDDVVLRARRRTA